MTLHRLLHLEKQSVITERHSQTATRIYQRCVSRTLHLCIWKIRSCCSGNTGGGARKRVLVGKVLALPACGPEFNLQHLQEKLDVVVFVISALRRWDTGGFLGLTGQAGSLDLPASSRSQREPVSNKQYGS